MDPVTGSPLLRLHLQPYLVGFRMGEKGLRRGQTLRTVLLDVSRSHHARPLRTDHP